MAKPLAEMFEHKKTVLFIVLSFFKKTGKFSATLKELYKAQDSNCKLIFDFEPELLQTKILQSVHYGFVREEKIAIDGCKVYSLNLDPILVEQLKLYILAEKKRENENRDSQFFFLQDYLNREKTVSTP
jgi:hypothetical protein